MTDVLMMLYSTNWDIWLLFRITSWPLLCIFFLSLCSLNHSMLHNLKYWRRRWKKCKEVNKWNVIFSLLYYLQCESKLAFIMTIQCSVELCSFLDERLYITDCGVTSPEQVPAYCVCRHVLGKRSQLVPVLKWKGVHIGSAVFRTVSWLHVLCLPRASL
jgi:hypothetical protein